jgi:hypothetical protein
LEGANGGRRQRNSINSDRFFCDRVRAAARRAPRIAIPGRLPITAYAVRARTAPSVIPGAMFHVKRCRRRNPPPASRPLIPRDLPGPPKHRIGHREKDRPACRQWQVTQRQVPSTSNPFPGPGESGRVQCVQAPGRFQWNDARPGQRGPAVTQGRRRGRTRACALAPGPDLRTARHDHMFHVKRARQPQSAVRAGAIRRPLQRWGMVSRETGRARFHHVPRPRTLPHPTRARLAGAQQARSRNAGAKNNLGRMSIAVVSTGRVPRPQGLTLSAHDRQKYGPRS